MMKSRSKQFDISHAAFVRELPCVRCGIFPCDAAHIRKGSDGGMGKKPSAWFLVPLCGRRFDSDGCHGEQHRKGEVTFWRGESGLQEARTLARSLYEISGRTITAHLLIGDARCKIFSS